LAILIAAFERFKLKNKKMNKSQDDDSRTSYSESLDVVPTEEASKHKGDPPHSPPFPEGAVAATKVVNEPVENGAKKAVTNN